MAKECPSCGKEYFVLLQCGDCDRQYCNNCTDTSFHLLPIPDEYLGLPGFSATCPSCGSNSKRLISEDD